MIEKLQRCAAYALIAGLVGLQVVVACAEIGGAPSGTGGRQGRPQQVAVEKYPAWMSPPMEYRQGRPQQPQ